MASQSDRKSIQSLKGIPPPPINSGLAPDVTDRWKGNPKPIPMPTKYGLSNVVNLYATIGSSSRTNPTARQTLLGGGPITPRRTVRDAGPKSYSSLNSSSRNKGKGRAIAPLEPRHPSPHEVIDVDADHVSTDDLDVIESVPTTSAYFDSKHTLGSRRNRSEPSVAGLSLVGDGENTKRLQARHDKTEPKQRSSSPIESCSEDEEGKSGHKSTKPISKVKEEVARIEARVKGSDIPIIDFKHEKFKSKMQPKSVISKAKLPSQIASDRLSRPSGLLGRGSTRSKQWSARLPISTLLIGIERLLEYDTIVFEDGGATISFETSSGSSRPIGPVSFSENNFADFQASDPNSLDASNLVILYLKTSGSASFASWQSNFSSVFQPGNSNRGQISVQFNTRDERWSQDTYRICLDKLVQCVRKRSMLRPAASKTLWTTLTGSIKYGSGNLHRSSNPMDNDEEQVHHRRGASEPDAEPSTHEDAHDPSIVSTESLMREQRVEELKKFRHTPDNRPVPSIRKRSSDTQRQNKDPAEVSAIEPPSKRQRTEEPKPLRRSTRQQEKAPNHDADEVILVYPFGVPGAVNVTTSDLARLQPEEFLNDTLIEFGLKSWLKELEATNPELASQVHVFNSFFYKKLNKRNIKEGYESVRKWTSKIDIFSKKYIIVPINEHLHWYLALIYEPEHTLQPPPPSLDLHSNAVTRRQARDMQAAGVVAEPLADPPSEPQPVVGVDQTQDQTEEDMQDGTTSENEVERLAFSTSCSIITTKENSSTTSSASEMKEELAKASDSLSPKVTPGSPMVIDDDFPIAEVVESSSRSAVSDSTMASGANTPVDIPDDPQSITISADAEVTPARFYGKSYTNRPRRMNRDSIAEPIIVDENPPDSRPSRTKVFIMDSLGNRHPQAMKQLSKWLELEATDKKKVENVTPPVAKMVPVPVQPNYCDCGLYILHFAATFMSDPQRYCQIIMTKERPSMAERQADWKDASVATMREELRHKILVFSEEWRQLRAAREEGKKQQQQQKVEEDEEDSDVAIVEHVKASGKKGKSSKSARTKG